MCHVLALLRWHDAQQQLYAEMVDDSIASDGSVDPKTWPLIGKVYTDS
jgi:hypothetical protein